MWIVFDSLTGEEIDSFEHLRDANTCIELLNSTEDFDHFEKRYEEC